MPDRDELHERMYVEPAAAFVRGACGPEFAGLDDHASIELALARGVRLHRFKRTKLLPRVRRVLGALRALGPTSLLDVGSGRGVSLWPLLEAFPAVPVTAIDQDPMRAEQLAAVVRGGVTRLTARLMNVTALDFPPGHFDVVTILEVLEHLPEPALAAAEALRVASRAVVASVPAHEDDNPEHLHLLDARRLEALLRSAGAKRVTIDGVRGHLVATAIR